MKIEMETVLLKEVTKNQNSMRIFFTIIITGVLLFACSEPSNQEKHISQGMDPSEEQLTVGQEPKLTEYCQCLESAITALDLVMSDDLESTNHLNQTLGEECLKYKEYSESEALKESAKCPEIRKKYQEKLEKQMEQLMKEIENPTVDYKNFVSNGSGKSKGLKFTLKYPSSWASQEADRPNIVRKFMGKNIGLMINIQILEDNLTFEGMPESDKKELFDIMYSKEGLKMMFPGHEIITSDPNQKIDGIRCVSLQTRSKEKRLNYYVYSKNLFYQMIYNEYLIQLNFAVIEGEEGYSSIESRFESNLPLFKSMANYFVITSQWE